MTRLVLAPSAAADLDAIFHHITRERPRAAIDLLVRLEAASRLIAEHPGIGRLRLELGHDLRSHVVGAYVIFYRAEPGQVLIIRYHHGARRLDPPV